MAVAFAFDASRARLPVARVAFFERKAQLEWEPEVIAPGLQVSPILYPPERGLQAARSQAFDGLHGFLADSLPEGWGRLLVRRKLSKLGVDLDALTPLDRLALVGDQGRGALTFEPATAPADDVQTLDLDELAAASAEILKGQDDALAGTLTELANASGGARPKIQVGFDANGAISVSDGEVAPGHEAWIVKFRANEDPLDIGPIEAAYAAMAQAAGLDLSAFRLLDAKSGPGYFATRRFDRPAPGLRLHMISLAGAIEAHPSLPSSYDVFLRATQAITRHSGDVQSAFRRMVFNVLACNRDDHTRQHSFLMSPAGNWRLAPAYDLTFSPGPGGEHYLDISGEGRRPTRDHARALGRRHGLSERSMAEIIESVRAAVADWSEFAEAAGVMAASRQMIAAAHETVRSYF
ncbi:MAG TPA: type II toxin-antitoxin system HipA family toxin [Caulobacteraceae bacterium]